MSALHTGDDLSDAAVELAEAQLRIETTGGLFMRYVKVLMSQNDKGEYGADVVFAKSGQICGDGSTMTASPKVKRDVTAFSLARICNLVQRRVLDGSMVAVPRGMNWDAVEVEPRGRA